VGIQACTRVVLKILVVRLSAVELEYKEAAFYSLTSVKSPSDKFVVQQLL